MTDPLPDPAVGVVVVAYGPEPELDRCLLAVRASLGVHVDLVVVDNGCTRGDLAELLERAGARDVGPPLNRGFAQGCNEGVAALPEGLPVALVNSDAIVAPTALRALLMALVGDVGIATASLRLAHNPALLNSAGNPVHFTGTSWAGAFGEAADLHARPREVAGASGATLVVRRDVWDRLGGFDPEYFTYCEDTELSLRCRLLGLRVVYAPDAVSVHHYAFSRNPLKNYYLERNRLLVLLTVLEVRTLLVLAPALLAWEVCVLAGAVLQGWGRPKVRGWWWLMTHASALRRRRQVVQVERRCGDDVLVPFLVGRITPGNVDAPPALGVINLLLGAYWWAARKVLSRPPRRAGSRRPSSA